MNKQFAGFYLLAMVLVATLGAGCDKAATPAPEPLTAEELPAAMQKAFANAKPEIKDLANQVVAVFQAKDYPKAFNTMQILAARPGLDKEQINVTTRATLTLNSLLQAAQAAGDQKAAVTIQQYQINK